MGGLKGLLLEVEREGDETEADAEAEEVEVWARGPVGIPLPLPPPLPLGPAGGAVGETDWPLEMLCRDGPADQEPLPPRLAKLPALGGT